MTKKCKLVLFGVFALLLCVSLALGAFGLSLANAETQAEENEQAPAATYHIGAAGTDDAANNVYYYATHSAGWVAAVAKAKEVYDNTDGNFVKVILDAEWKGTAGSSTGFGSGGATDPFYSGEINVPQGTRITIDLNGNTIDRNLGEKSQYEGRVFHIYGELTIDDNSASKAGKITGGYTNPGSNAGSGGGVRIRPSGKLVLKNGSITGNRAYSTGNVFGGGVYCEGTFEMYGGFITNNGVTNAKSNYGGGVCVGGKGIFNMYGGTISGNTAVTGGGLCLYTYSGNGTPTANIEGGTFENNKAIGKDISGVTAANIGGGAIGIVYDANLTIENCTINNNFAEYNGGGIFFYAGRGDGNTLTIKDCELKDNVVVSSGSAYGGAVSARRQNGAAASMTVNIEGNTVIENNKSIHMGSGSGSGCGAGISAFSCVVNLKSGDIEGNKTFKYTGTYTSTGTVSADVEAIDSWLSNAINSIDNSGYGGGIYVDYVTSSSIYGTLNMSGGVVKNNVANYGGGLYNNGAIINLSGGSVTGNTGVGGGGGLYSSANGVIQLSGAPVMTGNVKQKVNDADTDTSRNMHLNDGVMLVINGLTEGANIGVSAFTTLSAADNRARVFTRGYSEDEVKYFTSDRDDYYVFSNEAGELVFSAWEAEWELDGEKPESQVMRFTSGEDTFDTSKITYDGKPVEFFKNGVGLGVGATISVGGVYTATAVIEDVAQNVKPVFKVIFDRLDLVSDGADKNLYADIVGGDKYLFTGAEITPAVSVYVQLKDGSVFYPLYELSYENNVAVSTDTAKATAVITVLPTETNNGATVEIPFTILKSVTDAEYSVKWQYNDGREWRYVSDTDTPDFTYNGNDFSDRIRAELSYGDYNTVYATKESGTGSLFKLEIGEMINQGTYTVKVVVAENSGCSISGNDELAVVVKQLDLNGLSAVSFDATDSEMRPLWLHGNEYLLSTITYNVNGAAVTGTESNYYVRYTGKEETIALNESYTVRDYSIKQLKDLGAQVTYSNASATGDVNKLNQVVTTVTITFTDNFTNVQTITVTKNWAIVTINNGFVSNDSNDVYSVSGFTYGGDAVMSAPKPEHGDSVTVTINGASVEIRYDSDGSYKLYVDSDEINKTFEQYVTSLGLAAGTHTMEVTYAGDGENYFETKQSYQLVVAQREIDESDFVFDNASRTFTDAAIEPAVTKADGSDVTFTVSYVNNVNVGVATVVVTGTGNYTGTQLFTFAITAGANSWTTFQVTGWKYGAFDSKLIDITAAHGYVNYVVNDKDGQPVGNLALAPAGEYTLIATVAPSGNYGGLASREFTFKISKADNGWTVLPSVIAWKYGSFDINTNVILGTPNFGTPKFKIQNADGDDLTGEFELENGLVPESVKAVLAGLPYGTYKLIASVAESDNYNAITDDTVPFLVDKGVNDWKDTFNVISWSYGTYNKNSNPIRGSVISGTVTFAVTKDGTAVEGLESFTTVDDTIAQLLGALAAGDYAITATVSVDNNYQELNSQTIDFTIAKGANDWKDSFDIISWAFGSYNKVSNPILGSVISGTVTFTVKKGGTAVAGLESFTTVDDTIAQLLGALAADDYTLTATVTVDNNHEGLNAQTINFTVAKGANSWSVTPNVMQWKYEGYDKTVNLILGTAKIQDATNPAVFKITSDKEGNNEIIANFSLVDGLVPEAVAAKLAKLEVGSYYLWASVAETGSYSALQADEAFEFVVSKAVNGWTEALDIIYWSYGNYDKDTNRILGSVIYGTITYSVTKKDGTAVAGLESFTTVDDTIAKLFNSLVMGDYTITATVTVDDNHEGLSAQTINFSIPKGANSWSVTPNVMQWKYNDYDRTVNLILATAKIQDANNPVVFRVTSDKAGENEIIANFSLTDGLVPADVAAKLAKFEVGSYYLWASVDETDMYSKLQLDEGFEFVVSKGVNDWKVPVDVIGWSFDSFDKNTNRIMGSVQHGTVTFTVLKNGTAVAGLENFIEVDDAIAELLGALPVGAYSIRAVVAEETNYMPINEGSATLTVAKAINKWADGTDDLVLPSWVVGKFDPEENAIVVNAAYGNVIIQIRNRDNPDEVYYDSRKPEENTLNSLVEGKYNLVAWVEENTDYSALYERTFTIEVLKKIGLPWWGTTLVTVGALGLAAAIILILWKLKVFEILTDKISLAITTRATLDATIAAVRATKKAEEAEAHKRKVEAAERLQAAREAYRNKTPEQRAQDLQAKAEATSTRADEMHAKAGKMRERADKLAGKIEQVDEATEQPEDNSTEE